MSENILETFLQSITESEIESIGLKFLDKSIGKDYNDRYLQFVDKDGLFAEYENPIHYEILCMARNTPKYGNHEKNKIYIEIHFESNKFSSYFNSTVISLSENPDLETFYWRDYCPGLRIKNCTFDIQVINKNEILQTLKKLKELTIEQLKNTYTETIKIQEKYKPGFTLSCGR